MPFQIAARTVLQLGAELISSDGIAFYELIKNAFDAGSERVVIEIFQTLSLEVCATLRQRFVEIIGHENHAPEPVRTSISKLLQEIQDDPESPIRGAAAFLDKVRTSESWEVVMGELDRCNKIVINDSGSGMTIETLSSVYLTIGTPMRLRQRSKLPTRGRQYAEMHEKYPTPILGQKGLGRLSSMRLGQKIRVETTVAGEQFWNILDIDWRKFTHDSDALLGDVDIDPEIGPPKAVKEQQGTRIEISALTSDWSIAQLRELAARELNKFLDPFASEVSERIVLSFNNQPVSLPKFKEVLLEHAHASLTAHYSTDGEPQLTSRVNYKIRHKEQTTTRDATQLASISHATSMKALKAIGPFDVTLYWFNRKILRKELDALGDDDDILKIQAEWSGGLKLYRDGFRVNPYGAKDDDDWLALDRGAFAAQGYKVNRTQIVGKVDITEQFNPALVDQTNREGLRDCPEKRAFVAVLKNLLESQLRAFLTKVDADVRAQNPLDFGELGERIVSEEEQIHLGLKELVKRYPQLKAESEVVTLIEGAAGRVRDLMRSAQELAEQVESGRSQLLHLAGLGLMVEILSHELNRTTQNTLRTLSTSAQSVSDPKIGSVLRTLESQLKTLEKRLRVLDPLSVVGRQRKEEFDLIAWVEDILLSHRAQFQRHKIDCQIQILPHRLRSGLKIKAVRGMIVQIVENLLSNSVYWLKTYKRLHPNFSPTIQVCIDSRSREIMITDNGPGVEIDRAEEIFQPFVTSKPPGEGKGLGLYISREIAKYNGATLGISLDEKIRPNRLNTFVLQMGKEPK